MTVIIIIAVVGLLIYFGTRKKSEQTFIDNNQSSNTSTTSGQMNKNKEQVRYKKKDTKKVFMVMTGKRSYLSPVLIFGKMKLRKRLWQKRSLKLN